MITGGSGFIGTNLIDHFIARGDDVLNIDALPLHNEEHRDFRHACDLHNGVDLGLEVRSFAPEIIMHLAARTDFDGSSINDYTANTVGVENLNAAVEGAPRLRRIIFTSSRAVCRTGYQPKDEFGCCPTTTYGESKIIGEKIVRAAASSLPCPWTIVRPTSIWGPWFGVPYKPFFLSVSRGHYVHPAARQIFKSYGFVGNTVYELQRLLDAPAELVSERTLYLADYPPIDLTAMANAIQRALEVAPIKSVSVAFLHPVAWIGDCLKALGWRDPPLTSFRLGNLLTPMVYDLEPLQTIVGPLPHSMEDGVRVTAGWLRSRGEVS